MAWIPQASTIENATRIGRRSRCRGEGPVDGNNPQFKFAIAETVRVLQPDCGDPILIGRIVIPLRNVSQEPVRLMTIMPAWDFTIKVVDSAGKDVELTDLGKDFPSLMKRGCLGWGPQSISRCITAD